MEKNIKELYKSIAASDYAGANIILAGLLEAKTVARIQNVLTTQEEK